MITYVNLLARKFSAAFEIFAKRAMIRAPRAADTRTTNNHQRDLQTVDTQVQPSACDALVNLNDSSVATCYVKR